MDVAESAEIQSWPRYEAVTASLWGRYQHKDIMKMRWDAPPRCSASAVHECGNSFRRPMPCAHQGVRRVSSMRVAICVAAHVRACVALFLFVISVTRPTQSHAIGLPLVKVSPEKMKMRWVQRHKESGKPKNSRTSSVLHTNGRRSRTHFFRRPSTA